MERLQPDQIDVLVNGFRALLESYGPADPDLAVNPADAFFLYRLLLGRNPDAVIDLPGLLNGSTTFRELRQRVLDSDEFAGSGTFTPPGRLWMAQLDEFRFWFNTSDREMGVVMATGRYEPDCVRFIRQSLRPGMRCLDAGAQTGFYTCLMASLVGETGSVYAFEPMPESYERLAKNVEENRFGPHVHTFQLACSNRESLLDAFQVGHMYVAGTAEGCQHVTMSAVRVDDVVPESIDFIKMDVEGHEPAALEGMRELIARSHPIILSECNDYWLRSCSRSSSRDYVDLLKAHGYEVFEIGELSAALTPDSRVLQEGRIFDVVALPPDTVAARAGAADHLTR